MTLDGAAEFPKSQRAGDLRNHRRHVRESLSARSANRTAGKPAGAKKPWTVDPGPRPLLWGGESSPIRLKSKVGEIPHPLRRRNHGSALRRVRMEILLGTIFIGLSAGMFAYAGTAYYGSWFDFFERDIRDKLRRLRINTKRLRFYLTAWLVFAAVVFLLQWIVLDILVLGLMSTALLICLPWYIVRRMAEKRRQQIEDQLADSMVSLANAIKAGLSLAQAMEILAHQTPHPICQEFQQIHGEYQLGKPMEECLVETKRRLRSENFALFAAAMEASRESGGRLNETVDRIAHSVRELQRLERKVQSETAQARASAFYMALAPVFILAIYYFIMDRENTERLWTTVPGQILLSIAIVLNILAYLWARKILSPDI